MEMEVRDADKKVLIWLTHAESNSVEMKESLKPIYREFKAKKYLVAVFESGKESLEELTREELEAAIAFANKAAAITTSRHGAIPAMPTLAELK